MGIKFRKFKPSEYVMVIKKGKYPSLKIRNCIRCWCCAEVCPQNAILKSKRPLLGQIVLKTKQ